MATFDSDAILKIANSPVLAQFLHECVDDLIDRKAVNFANYNSDVEWTNEDFNKARNSIQTLYRQSVITDSFNLTNEFPANVAKEIEDCYNIRKNDIFAALAKENLLANGCNLVENFDWKLKWIVGSSKLASIREALLQVDFNCVKNGELGEEKLRKTISFEMDLEQVNSLIRELEKVTENL